MSSNQSRTEHRYSCSCWRCEAERKVENREESKRKREEWNRP